MSYEDGEFYWVLPIDAGEWEVAKCKKARRAGFLPLTWEFYCSDSGILTTDDCAKIIKIERPNESI